MATVKHASETWTRKLVSNLEGALRNAVATVNAYAQSVEAAMRRHVDRRDNPHGVTRAQIGLGNVDNTADVDKPLSRPQGDALSRAVADAAAPKADKAKFAAFNAIVLPEGATQNQQAAALKAVIDALRNVALAAALAVAAPAFGDVAGGTQWGDVPPATRMDDVCRLFADVLGYADATNAIAGAVKVGETRDLSDVAAGGGVALNWIVGADTVFGVRVRDGRWRITTVDGDLATESFVNNKIAAIAPKPEDYTTTNAVKDIVTNEVIEYTEWTHGNVWESDDYDSTHGSLTNFGVAYIDGEWKMKISGSYSYEGAPKVEFNDEFLPCYNNDHDALEVAFTWDGVYLPATRSKVAYNSLGLARLKDIQHFTNVYTKGEVDSKVENAVLPTNPAFSNAVLAVGLNIDTNSVAVLNEIAETFGGFPIEGTATTVGGLLAALAAAVAWLKKNKADKATTLEGYGITDAATKAEVAAIDARLSYQLNAVADETGLLKDRAINTTSLASVTVPDNFTDLLIRASVASSLSVTMPEAITKYGDTFPGEAGEYLITITKTGAAEAYVRTIKLEEVA